MKKISLAYQCERCEKSHNNKFEARECYDSHSPKACICCLREFVCGENNLWYYDRDTDRSAFSVVVRPGYPSHHDEQQFEVLICDECMDRYLSKDKLQKGATCVAIAQEAINAGDMCTFDNKTGKIMKAKYP